MTPEDPYRPPPEGQDRADGPPSGQPYFSPVPESELVAPRGGGGRGWGIATGIVVPILVAVLVPLIGNAVVAGSGDGQSSWAPSLAGLLGVVPGLLLVAAVVLAALPRTRRFGTGVLLGLGILLVVAAGTCVVLVAGLSGAMNG